MHEVGKYKILVTEDNDFVRMQIVKYLTDAGYDVDEFSTATEAFQAVLKTSYNLALVDVRMEPMDGFEFIRAVRGENVKVPMILVTGDNDPDLLSEASRLGVAAVLIKPVQKDRLLKTAEKTIQKMGGGQ